MKLGNKWTFAVWCSLIGGVFVLLVSARGLSGQTFEQRVDNIVSRARFRFGPLRFYPVLEFSQFGWTSNIYGEASPEQLVFDFVITPSPKLNVYFILRRRLILSFTENPEYHFYFKSHRYNHFANNYRTELSFPFFGSLIITAGFFSQSQRSLAVAELDRQVETATRGIRTEVSYETGRRISFNLRGLFSQPEYKDILGPEASADELGRNLDRQEYSGELEVRYKAFTSSVFFVQAGYSRYLFLDEASNWKDSQSARFMFGFRLPTGGRLSGSLAAGFRKLLNPDSTTKGYSGFIADTQLSYRLGSATFLSAGYNHDLMFSYLADTLFCINDSFNTGLTVNVGRLLSVRIGGNYSLLRHSGLREGEMGVDEPVPPPGRTDRYGGFTVGFSLPILRGLRAGLSYHYWTRPTGFPDKRNGHLVTFDLIRQ